MEINERHILTENFLNIPIKILKAMLDNQWEAFILVNEKGIIHYMSESIGVVYGIEAKEMIGRHITDLNPESGLPRVLKSGTPEIGNYSRYRIKERIVSRIPLFDEAGKIIGAVAQIQDPLTVVEVLEGRLEYYQKELTRIYGDRYALGNIIGESKLMQEAKHVMVQASKSNLAVLITGETGTGKEIFAQAIHQLSDRHDQPFVRVNCAAIPYELIESELFGYEAGAFTGADRRGKPGKFELAANGTIFLDEIGDMPLPMQVKLLRVLQEHEVERVGGTKTLKLDFRVIAATNRDIKNLIKNGKFRQDLFYRLNIFHIKTPPLRLIRKDIPRIAYYLLSKQQETNRHAPRKISNEGMHSLINYDWPGNVRELQNVLDRASVQARSDTIEKDDLGFEITENLEPGFDDNPYPRPLKEEVAAAEIRAIKRALEYTEGNRAQAAKLLNIHRTGLYQKLRQYNLDTV